VRSSAMCVRNKFLHLSQQCTESCAMCVCAPVPLAFRACRAAVQHHSDELPQSMVRMCASVLQPAADFEVGKVCLHIKQGVALTCCCHLPFAWQAAGTPSAPLPDVWPNHHRTLGGVAPAQAPRLHDSIVLALQDARRRLMDLCHQLRILDLQYDGGLTGGNMPSSAWRRALTPLYSKGSA